MHGRAFDLCGRDRQSHLRAAELGYGEAAAVARAGMGEIGREKSLPRYRPRAL